MPSLILKDKGKRITNFFDKSIIVFIEIFKIPDQFFSKNDTNSK